MFQSIPDVDFCPLVLSWSQLRRVGLAHFTSQYNLVSIGLMWPNLFILLLGSSHGSLFNTSFYSTNTFNYQEKNPLPKAFPLWRSQNACLKWKRGKFRKMLWVASKTFVHRAKLILKSKEVDTQRCLIRLFILTEFLWNIVIDIRMQLCTSIIASLSILMVILILW